MNCFKMKYGFLSMSFELTLALIKPHVVKVPYAVEAIRSIILENCFYVVRSKHMMLTTAQVKEFYNEHSERFFYNRLITFMQSGPVEAYVLARVGAIEEWRKLLGPTKTFQAQYSAPNSIRGKYGLTDTRNALHGSDSPTSACKEISIIFPEIQLLKWMENEKTYFEKGLVKFQNDKFIHTCLT